jgi:hypothetical protein
MRIQGLTCSGLGSSGREALFEEDCTEEEVAEELAPITVQLGFVLGRQGRSADALEAYEQVRLKFHSYFSMIRQNNEFTAKNQSICN